MKTTLVHNIAIISLQKLKVEFPSVTKSTGITTINGRVFVVQIFLKETL